MGLWLAIHVASFWQAPRFRERLIVESWNRSRRHLSISFWKRSRLPLLEPLLENIECWPVELVAAGGLTRCATEKAVDRSVGGFVNDASQRYPGRLIIRSRQ